jgi:hypothetical protein
MLRRTSTPTRLSRVSAKRVTQVRCATFCYGITSTAFHTDNGLALESGVNEMVENKFEQPAGLKYGPGATASGSDHRVIPEDEGGTRDDRNR